MGAVAASFVGKEGAAIADALGLPLQGWQMAYVVGGALGLVLLVLRAGAFESGLFAQVHARTDVTKGDFLALFRTRAIALRYLACIAIGLPVWFAVGVLINKSHVIGPAIGVRGVVHTGTSVMWGYIGLSVGDLFSGLLSQWMRSRRKVILLYLAFQTLCVLVLFFQGPMSLEHFYFMCLMIGISTGFWALFVTVASEQFGTNLRSTVTSTVPNFVRGAVIPITLSYVALRGPWGETAAVLITGGVCIGLSLIATLHVRETFEDDMDFLEG